LEEYFTSIREDARETSEEIIRIVSLLAVTGLHSFYRRRWEKLYEYVLNFKYQRKRIKKLNPASW
jgi:hypothetical protein